MSKYRKYGINKDGLAVAVFDSKCAKKVILPSYRAYPLCKYKGGGSNYSKPWFATMTLNMTEWCMCVLKLSVENKENEMSEDKRLDFAGVSDDRFNFIKYKYT